LGPQKQRDSEREWPAWIETEFTIDMCGNWETELCFFNQNASVPVWLCEKL